MRTGPIDFAAPAYLWLLAVPAALLGLWVWSVTRRARDLRRLREGRVSPVRERWSLAGDLPPISHSLIKPGHTVCYDMMYGKDMTAFNRWAAEHGAARTLDGLGMLVEQAAEAFLLWRGVLPDSAPVLAELRRQLAQS